MGKRIKVKSYMDNCIYSFKTLYTKHKECMEKISFKCTWEQRARTAIIVEYPKLLCKKCKLEIDTKKEDLEG